jgi:hypothetical protein
VSATASSSRSCCRRRRTCCCSTSRPTTSTWTRCARSRRRCSTSPAASSSPPTTAGSSTVSRPTSSPSRATRRSPGSRAATPSTSRTCAPQGRRRAEPDPGPLQAAHPPLTVRRARPSEHCVAPAPNRGTPAGRGDAMHVLVLGATGYVGGRASSLSCSPRATRSAAPCVRPRSSTPGLARPRRGRPR